VYKEFGWALECPKLFCVFWYVMPGWALAQMMLEKMRLQFELDLAFVHL
jgi:hypothetical protein